MCNRLKTPHADMLYAAAWLPRKPFHSWEENGEVVASFPTTAVPLDVVRVFSTDTSLAPGRCLELGTVPRIHPRFTQASRHRPQEPGTRGLGSQALGREQQGPGELGDHPGWTQERLLTQDTHTRARTHARTQTHQRAESFLQVGFF